MAPGLRLQLGQYCRASFDSKSFAKVDVTDGQRAIFNHESRALPVLLPHTRPLRHIVVVFVVVVIVSGIQPTPIAWGIIISSGAGNHCEKSRDDSVYKPMTTDGDFLLRFLSKHKNLLLIFKLNKKMASMLSYGCSFTAYESLGKPSFSSYSCIEM